MKHGSVPVTLDAIEELLDRKFEEKLKPIHEEIADIKDVVEHEFKRTNNRIDEGFSILNGKIERLEEINVAVIQDHDGLEARTKRLEKHAGFNKN